jgi:hypothetical protein
MVRPVAPQILVAMAMGMATAMVVEVVTGVVILGLLLEMSSGGYRK